MQSLRLPLNLICIFAALGSVLLLAQSNPVAHPPKQETAVPGAQTPPARVEGQAMPAAQAPSIRFAASGYIDLLSGGDSGSIAIAGLNGNSYPDLVVANGTDMFSVLVGGSINPFGSVTYSTGGISAQSAAVADLNGDGNVDVVLGGVAPGQSEVVAVFLGNGDGSFQAPVNYSTGTGGVSHMVAIADLNGDGHPDLVIATACLSSSCSGKPNVGGVSVLLGNGDGTFQAPVTFSSGGWDATAVAIGDLNGDGYPDLAVSNLCQLSADCPTVGAPPGELSVFLGNGDGSFQAPVNYSSGGSWATSVAIADLNGDGHPDLVAANFFISGDSVGVLLGNGNGTFQTPVNYGGSAALANSVAIGDVNGDGYPDLVVAYQCDPNQRDCGGTADGGVTVLLGNGDGTFQNPINYSTLGMDAVSVAVGDLNNDGRPDIAVLNDSNLVGVLSNLTSYSTKTVATSSSNSTLVNQPVTFTATITSTPPVPNGEIVTFSTGSGAILGTGTTTNGVTTLTRSFPKAVAYTIKATYSGDPFRRLSTGVVKEVASLYASTTTLSSSPNPSTSRQAVTLTATVSSAAPGGPSGTVTFKNGTISLGTATLSAGTSTLSTMKLPIGALTLTADYHGDAQSAKSSGSTTQTVGD